MKSTGRAAVYAWLGVASLVVGFLMIVLTLSGFVSSIVLINQANPVVEGTAVTETYEVQGQMLVKVEYRYGTENLRTAVVDASSRYTQSGDPVVLRVNGLTGGVDSLYYTSTVIVIAILSFLAFFSALCFLIVGVLLIVVFSGYSRWGQSAAPPRSGAWETVGYVS